MLRYFSRGFPSGDRSSNLSPGLQATPCFMLDKSIGKVARLSNIRFASSSLVRELVDSLLDG